MPSSFRARSRVSSMALQLAADAGLAPDALLETAGLSAPALADNGEMLDSDQLVRLTQAAISHLGDAELGLHFGQRFEFTTMGAFPYVVMNAPIVEVALRNMARYAATLVDGVRLEFVGDAPVARFDLHFGEFDESTHRHVTEAAAVIFVRFLRKLVGDAWNPLSVCFPHDAPSSLQEHLDFFGCDIAFGQGSTSIAFDAGILPLAIEAADRDLLPIIERHLDDVIEAESHSDRFHHQIEKSVAGRVCDGHPTIRGTARELGLSVRTLQRRLDDRGLCYRDVVARVRERLAIRYLCDTEMSLSEIAFLLGYSELSAFDRAFRAWQNDSPRSYRRAHRSP